MLRQLVLAPLVCALLVFTLLADDEDRPKTPLDLNSATRAELAELPGVGEVIAQRIIRHREISGPFRSVDELIIIRGISRKKLEVLRPLVAVKTKKQEAEGKTEEKGSR
jgi:competence ComEA-like helix-hairpin-helix protein